jgi:hypothetical protein
LIELDAAVRCADCIVESVSLTELARVGRPTGKPALLQRIEELSRWVEAYSAERDHRLSSSRDPHYSPKVSLPAPEIATSTTVRPPSSIMQQPPAGTIGSSETGRKIVSRLAATAGKDSGGECLH